MKIHHHVGRFGRIGICGLVIALSLALPAFAQLVDLSESPLFAGGAAPPNVVVVPSLEFPTAGQAYLGAFSTASAYSSATTYVGYFDPTKCYAYISTAPKTNGVPTTEDPNGYFKSSGAASGTYTCTSSNFSGNFLNFATMTALDEFRYAMTGGNRSAESGPPNNGTLLQRAYLSGCNPSGPAYGGVNGNCSNATDGQFVGIPDFYGSGSRAGVATGSGVNVLFPTTGVTSAAAVMPLNRVTSGATAPNGFINNCKTFMYVTETDSPTNGGNCSHPFKDLGVYNIQVDVCDDIDGPSRIDLCLQYGGTSGHYKPVGQVQRYADKMRFATFGYLIDRNVTGYTVPSGCDDGSTWNRCRVGGVLRSPMKYVGPTTYSATLVPSTNPKSEINADGTYVIDPEGTASTAGGIYSGFINYLNRFGSQVQAAPISGTGGAGAYKRYDPIAEMYYEAIRYFQNLTPTPETFSGSPNNEVKGYLPILTTWTDPILAQCSANFIISIGDTDTWDDVYLPGYNGSPAPPPLYYSSHSGPAVRPSSRSTVGAGGLDAYAWTAKIGVLEAGTPSLTTNDVRPTMTMTNGGSPLPATTMQDQYTGSTGTASYFSAGAAYWANTNDIRTDLPGKQTITTISVDTGGQLRLPQDRQLLLMGKYGGFNNTIDRVVDGTQENPFYATNPANPTGPAIRSNSEWLDPTSAPGNPFPTNYLFASSPQKLIAGLQTAFASIAAQSGTAAGAAIQSTNLVPSGGGGVYVSNFKTARWSGTVLFENVTVSGSTFTVSPTAIWDSGALLTARCGAVVAPISTVCTDTSTSASNRNIVTTIKPSTTRVAAAFTYANISTDATYKGILNTNPSTGVSDGNAQQRINYLRGYRADEVSSLLFRTRDSVMGDIINSAPVYEGAPTTGITDASYQAFFASNVGRSAAVYVGANDGMLHAFDANSGSELFGYIPGFGTDDLNDLTNPAYVHETFVDAVPAVAEATVNGSWKTVLVSGVGASAQGVFALDVTTPTAFSAANVIFEFSDADDADLGNVTRAPVIVKLQTGGTATAPTYGFFAVVTGYNNRRTTINGRTDTHVSTDTNNRSVLFLLSLDRTLGTPWVLGSNYYKYFFPATNTAVRNGLGAITPLKSASGDGTTAALYFGDLQGNLWRFNTVGLPAAWTPSRGSVSVAQPMFVATSSTGVAQPITAAPEIVTGPFGSTLVAFGTGAYLGTTDLATPYAQQSQYVLFDNNSGALITRSTDLVQETATISGSTVTVSGPTPVYSGSGAAKGWVMDFPATSLGERMVNKAAAAPGVLTFTSLTLSGSVCGSGGGYVYQLNPLTGQQLVNATTGVAIAGGNASTVGIPGPPIIVDIGITPGQPRATGETINVKTQAVLVSGTSGGIATLPSSANIVQKMPPVGRVSWREITNYNDRH